MMVEQGVPVRRACWIMGVSTAQPYRKPAPDRNAELRERLKEILRPSLGYRMAHDILKRTNAPLNVKRVYRLWKQEKLSCVKRHRKKRTGSGVQQPSSGPNDVWSVDFIHDACANGTRIKILTVLDEFTRECLALDVGTSIDSKRVRAVLSCLFSTRGTPKALRSDNGGEFISRTLAVFLAESGTESRFIKPGSPWQNGYVESFHATMRREILDAEVFCNLADARMRIGLFRDWVNEERPHSSTGRMPPALAARERTAPGGVPDPGNCIEKKEPKTASTPED